MKRRDQPFIILSVALVGTALILAAAFLLNKHSEREAQQAAERIRRAGLTACFSQAEDTYRNLWDEYLKLYGNGKDQTLPQEYADSANKTLREGKEACFREYR